MYNPDNQYRCTIIRGKSQTEMEDLLPLYANIVNKYCPCNEDIFKQSAYSELSNALFNVSDYSQLTDNNQKTVRNHYTEIMGTLLGLFYPRCDSYSGKNIIYESESCRFVYENSDLPTFFKNLCLNFQFPNGEKKATSVIEEIKLGIKLKPFCFVIELLYIAQKNKQLLAKQEVGYYALNNLDVLCGRVSPHQVYERIIEDRKHGVKKSRLSGSNEWQHIKEQFNLLELAGLVEHDAERIWLNHNEAAAISLFIKYRQNPYFDVSAYDMSEVEGRKIMAQDWKKYNGQFNNELLTLQPESESITQRGDLRIDKTAIKSTSDLGDEGEAFVFRLERERVKKFKEKLANKVLLLGKTKGLGYDISSIEADENPENPEFARYIEVKSTKRITRPSFSKTWADSINITRKEWIAAQQFGHAYNIYRVYFTKTEVIVIRVHNPFALSQQGKISVIPTVYQMEFGSDIIQQRFPL